MPERYTADCPYHWSSRFEPLRILYLDHNPEQAARWHADRHLSRGVLEAAQILSTVWHLQASDAIGEEFVPPPYGDRHSVTGEVPGFVRTLAGQRIYRPSFPHHPCVLWAQESLANYDWLWRFGMALAAEFTHRYDRRAPAASVLWTLESPPPGLGDASQSEPPVVMPYELRFTVDGLVHAVPSYRNFYAEEADTALTWRRREPPPWLESTPAGWRAIGLIAD